MGTLRFHPEEATRGDCAQRNTHTQVRANKKKSPFSPSFNMIQAHGKYCKIWAWQAVAVGSLGGYDSNE